MKYNVDGVIVVEGKSDVCYLSSFLNALFFTTNGYDLSFDKIEFLKEVSKHKKIIIMTDSDAAGEVIRNKLQNQINSCFVAKTSGISRKLYKKHGVAEGQYDEILKLLENHIINEQLNYQDYRLSLYLDGSELGNKRKNKLMNSYRLIQGNNKSIENQLRMLDVNIDEFKKLMEDAI